MELIPSTRWSHVNGADNPADCASRGMFPSELIRHKMWWSGPDWLKLPPDWTKRNSSCASMPEEACSEELCHHTHHHTESPVIPLNRYSDFNHLTDHSMDHSLYQPLSEEDHHDKSFIN